MSEEKLEANLRRMKQTQAMECGETYFSQAEGPHDPLGKVADASLEAVRRNMDLGKAPAWMRREHNYAWFAARPWGEVIWRCDPESHVLSEGRNIRRFDGNEGIEGANG